ncbi:MAG: cupin domain-containing protein [Pseudomonadota bacterium]
MTLRYTLLGPLLVCAACHHSAAIPDPAPDTKPSAVVSEQSAQRSVETWGDFLTYFDGETFSTRDLLNGVAIIKPGQEIHPPHRHAEEEFLMVIEGNGRWHLNGEDFAASAGDTLYAAPWDIHGITNTGDTPLRFVVWKWASQAQPLPTDPQSPTTDGTL